MILVVDDNSAIAEVLRDALDEAGYDVAIASTGTDALRLIVERPCDMILLDLSLPDMNGVELVEQIRAVGHDMPIAAVSGAMPLIDPQKLASAGFVQTFPKPVRLSTLVEFVGQFVPPAN